MTHKPVLKDRNLGRKKLALSKETLRELTPRELDGILGAADTATELATRTRLCSEAPLEGVHVTPFK
jgi:hypothetical protein